MRHYIAIIHKDADSDFGISFPDFPGCVSAGSTLDEAVRMGREALSGHVQLLAEDGEAIPEASSLEAVLADPDNRDGTPVLVPAPNVSAKTVRVNITLPEDVLREIDTYAEAKGYTRSGLLVSAVRQMMKPQPRVSVTEIDTDMFGSAATRSVTSDWFDQHATRAIVSQSEIGAVVEAVRSSLDDALAKIEITTSPSVKRSAG